MVNIIKLSRFINQFFIFLNLLYFTNLLIILGLQDLEILIFYVKKKQILIMQMIHNMIKMINVLVYDQ
jgi:hypothetical protein